MNPIRLAMRRAARWAIVASLFAMLSLGGVASAQETSPSPAASTAPPASLANAPAALRYFNRDIVVLRVPFYGNSPARRVAVAQANIARIIDEPGAAKVSYQAVPQGRF